MADLLVVTGPPGAGKSTVAALLPSAFQTAALVSGDAFFAFWARGAIPPWLPEAHEQNEVVIRAAARAAGAFVGGGCPVVYDGVVGPWSLPAFFDATGLPRLHYVVLLPAVEVCLHRVAARVGHGFDDPAATEHMHADFTRAEAEPRHVLLDPPPRPEDVADLVLQRFRAGALTYPA